jgi:hypothetical protein
MRIDPLFLFIRIAEMKKLRESRKKKYFEVPEGIELHVDGVDIEDGQAVFYKIKFQEDEDCEKWMDENDAELTRKKKYHTELKSATVTDDEWGKIQKLMTAPEAFKKEDIRVYHPMLAHNFVDRDGERFPKGVLQRFSNTIIDKSMLFGHSWGDPGEGRFFDCKLVQIGVDQAVKMVGNHPAGENFRKQLEKIVGIDGGLFLMNPSFYMLADDEELCRKIDAGIIKDMSIGFRARKEPRMEGDAQLWVEYLDTDQVEAIEGSFVFLGSQYGAANRKNMKSNGAGFQEKPDASDEPVDKNKSHGAEPEKLIIANNGGTMKIELKSIELAKEIELNDEAVQGVLKEVESKYDAKLVDATEKAGKAEADLKVAKDEAQANEPWVTAGKAYKTELVSDVMRLAGLLGLIEKSKIEDETKFHETLELNRLKTMRDTYQAKWNEKNPSKSQTPEPADKKKKIEPNTGYQDNGGY